MMKKYLIAALICVAFEVATATDSLQLAIPQPKRFWTAASEVVGLNVGVWGFDRYGMNQDFARIGFNSIGNNFSNGFVWDNDQFSTNLFAHPYHGNLYFNSARNNGYNFWQSVPFAFAGSLMWEMVAENEPPSINDLIATSIGGSALGEAMYRISDLFLDNSATGFERVAREAAALVICPVKGFNRIIRGDMWRYNSVNNLYHDFDKIPVRFNIGTGIRYLANNQDLFRGESHQYVNLGLNYGSNYVNSENPYDHFMADFTFGLFGNQPLIGKINLIGRLWGLKVLTEADIDISIGLYQYFNYFDSESVLDGSERVPFKIAEAASIGPGFVYSIPSMNELLKLRQSLYFGGILLGGSLSDYYKWINRNYNMGSGFSVKSTTQIEYVDLLTFELNMYLYRIYTWKGYEEKDLENGNPLLLNVQGDQGNVMMAIINPTLKIPIVKNLLLNISAYYYLRESEYKYYENVEYNTFETQVGIEWHF